MTVPESALGAGPDAVPVSGSGLDALTVLQTLRHLDSGPRGLTEAEAEERQARFGANTLPDRREASWPTALLRSLRDPFTAVLLCLGLVSAAVASWGTACVILLLVVVSCVLRASGEHRADRSMAALREPGRHHGHRPAPHRGGRCPRTSGRSRSRSWCRAT